MAVSKKLFIQTLQCINTTVSGISHSGTCAERTFLAISAERFFVDSWFSTCTEIRLPVISRLFMLLTSSISPLHSDSLVSQCPSVLSCGPFCFLLILPHSDQQLPRSCSVWADYESCCFVARMHSVVKAWRSKGMRWRVNGVWTLLEHLPISWQAILVISR